MDSPVRQYQKQKDYRRHKLFRKINRRKKAERQQAIDAPMKELRRRLKRFDGGKDTKKELPYPLRTSSDYDDNLAYQSGIVRDPKTSHMWSTTQEEYPAERTYLKKPNHPTYGKAIWGDMAGGYQVYRRGDRDYAAPNFAEMMYTKAPFKYGGGKDVEEEQPVISGQQPDMSWHRYWLSNRADILGHNIKDTEIHPIWALQELTGYNFPGFEKIGKERIEEELNNAQKFREYTSPNEMPEKAIQFLHRNLPRGITDQQAYDARMGGNAGVTYPYQNMVMYHPFSTNVARGHERTHILNATAQEKKVKQIMMDQYEDRSWFDDYYEDPSEIYARLMNFRYMAKLNPKKKVTVEDLEKWRSDFDLNYGVYAPADNLLRRYNNDTLLRLFNEVAQNNTENVLNEDGLLMANSGKDSGIHIKPENRGKFTALKKRTGKSASWFKAHGTPAQKKMATFALNSRKWRHK